MTLTEFLLARIAEDEDCARGATVEPVGSGRTWFDGWSDTHPVGMHIGRWTPARVLAECEAKRRIVEACEAGCECHASGTTLGQTDWDRTILRALALPYADHPDYDEAWRP